MFQAFYLDFCRHTIPSTIVSALIVFYRFMALDSTVGSSNIIIVIIMVEFKDLSKVDMNYKIGYHCLKTVSTS